MQFPPNITSLAVAVTILLAILMDLTSASTIDACQVVAQAVAQGSSAATIDAQTDTTSVHFADCGTLQPNMHITVRVPVGGTSISGLDILLRNVVMHGGSLKIIPGAATASVPLIRDVAILVDNVVLKGTGDVLLVDTRGATTSTKIAVSNLTMVVLNSILTTSGGSVASVLAEGTALTQHVRIGVLGNSTLHASGAFVASVSTNRAVNTTLVLDTSSCRGPVSVRAGGSTAAHVGAFSIVPPYEDTAVRALIVETLSILVTSSASGASDTSCPPRQSGIFGRVLGQPTVGASFGGISLNHPDETILHMTGLVNIVFSLTGHHRGDESNAFVFDHNIEVSRIGEGGNAFIASTVGGIAVTTFRVDTYSTSRLTLGDCTLNISFSSVGQLASPRVRIATTANGGVNGLSVFGVALNALSKEALSTSILQLTDGSTITIAGGVALQNAPDAVHNRSIALVSEITNDGGASSTTVLGVAVHSYSRRGTAKTVFSVTEDSKIRILSSLFSAAGNISLATTVHFHSASSVLGIAVGSGKWGSDSRGGTLDAVVRGQIIIKSFITDGVSLAATITDSTKAVSSIIGIAVFDDQTGTLKLAGTQPAVEVWLSVLGSPTITIERPQVSAAMALVSYRPIVGITSQNTILNYCSDGSLDPTTTSAVYGAALGIQPPVGWEACNKSTSLVFPPPPQGTAASWCTRKTVALQAEVSSLLSVHGELWPWDVDGLQRPPTLTSTLVATLTPTSTGTHSSTTSMSRSLPRTNSHPATNTRTMSSSLSHPATSTTGLTASRTLHSHSLTLQPVNTTAAPAQPPVPPRRSAVTVTSVMLPGDESTVTVVVSSAGAAKSVVSTLGSGGASVVVVAGATLRVLECGLSDDEPRPSFFEFPIQVPLGTTNVRFYTGAVLAHTMVQLLFFAAPVFLRRQHQQSSSRSRPGKAVSFLATTFCATHGFFTPTILGGVSTVLAHSDGDSTSVAVALVCGASIVAIHLVVLTAVHTAPRRGLVARAAPSLSAGGSMKLEFEVDPASTHRDDSSAEPPSTVSASNTSSSLLLSAEGTKDILLTLFDGCRTYEEALHRHYATVEITLASLASVVSGLRPQERCEEAAFAVGALAALGLVYVVLVRPFRTRLDTVFSTFNNLVLAVLCLSVAAAVQQTRDGKPLSSSLERTMQLSMWLMSAMAFVQLGVQGYWAYHVGQRRKHSQQEEDSMGTQLLQIQSGDTRDDRGSSSSDDSSGGDKSTTSGSDDDDSGYSGRENPLDADGSDAT